MPLTQAQQELLTAWIDGQATGAEAEAASKLAAEPEAARWVQTTRALRTLVRRHTAVKAPAFLKSRVLATLDEDFDDISRPTASLIPIRRALMALAAGLVLALGVYFVATNVPQDTDTSTQVSRAPTGREPARGPGSMAGPAVPPAPQPTPELPPKSVSGKPDGSESRNSDDPAKGGERGDLKPPAPGQGGDSWAEGSDHSRRKDRPAITVLNLDRGNGHAHQLSLELDRNSGANALQTYNDLLVVACMYADARLVNGDGSAATVDNDFAVFDGLEIEVSQDSLADLLAAVRKLSDDQQYGSLAVPEDLEQPVDDTQRLVRELAEVRRDLAGRDARTGDETNENHADDTQESVRGYLPPRIQTEQLRRESTRAEKTDAMGRLDKSADSRSKLEAATATSPEQGAARKIKLVLRLQ